METTQTSQSNRVYDEIRAKLDKPVPVIPTLVPWHLGEPEPDRRCTSCLDGRHVVEITTRGNPEGVLQDRGPCERCGGTSRVPVVDATDFLHWTQSRSVAREAARIAVVMVIHRWIEWVPTYRHEAFRTAFQNSLVEIPRILAGEKQTFGSTARAFSGLHRAKGIPAPARKAMEALRHWYQRHPSLERSDDLSYLWGEHWTVRDAIAAGLNLVEWYRRVKFVLAFRDVETAEIY